MRVALIGYGLAGRFFHAPLIAAVPSLQLEAVVTGNAERAAAARSEVPGVEVVGAAEDLWAREWDLVVVATANASHASLANAAIDHGVRAVVVDKPLALSSEEAAALASAAADNATMLVPFHNRRWDSDQLTLRRLIEDGRLGTVLRYESRFERWRPTVDPGLWRSGPPEEGGGLLLDLGTHLVDQALHHFGPVEGVYAEVASVRGVPAEDDAFIALTHSGGVISHLHASAVAAAPGPRLRVLGTEAALIVDALDSQEDALRAGKRPGPGMQWGAEPLNWGRLVAGDTVEPVVAEPGAWPRFYELLAAALTDGGPPPVDVTDAITGLQIIETARRYALTE